MSENNSGKWPDRPRVFPESMTPAVLPDGSGGFTPCPELLTEEEAIRFLRLDGIGIENPANTLKYYRKKGLLRATQVGKCIRYRRIELDGLLDRLTETNPR
ncbi:MAG: helix-turn-helix domain-containing protein [Planctomycetota bacterium]